jgi:hypothetical protein
MEPQDGRGDCATTRQRDLFPLPHLDAGVSSTQRGQCSRAVHRRHLRKSHAVDWANDGIDALNWLSGRERVLPGSPLPATCVSALDYFRDTYIAVGGPPPDDSPDGALRALLGSSRVYAQDRSDIQPYTKDRVSWPSVGSAPVPIVPLLDAADQPGLAGWEQHLLRDPREAADARVQLGVRRPYSDPTLMSSPAQYGGFLREAYQRGLIRFRHRSGKCAALGVFFVIKKDGRSLRIIFDTRFLNCEFHKPPSTSLATAAAFGRLETPVDVDTVIGTGDVSNAFYGLGVPQLLAEKFTLEVCPARFCGACYDDGTMPGPNELVEPYLVVLPMGWNWALHFCQSVINRAVATVIGDDRMIGDKDASVVVSKPAPGGLHMTKLDFAETKVVPHQSDIAAAVYVDNFAIIGTNP